MLSTKRCLTVLTLAALATVPAQAQTTHPTAGYPVCFGDGTGTPCPNNNPGKWGHGCENSVRNGGGLLWADGMGSVSRDTITLRVESLPRDSTVLFMQATGCRNNEMGFPFGNGLMCMGGSVRNLGAFRTSDGTAEFPRLGGPSLSKAGSISPTGGERYYQVLYRDSNGPLASSQYNFNLTNAWSITWVK